jgi:hypothetical protein
MISQLQTQIKSYEEEIPMPLQKNLSRSEESRLDQLTIECDSMSRLLSEISFKRTEVYLFSYLTNQLEAEKQVQEIELNSNFIRRHDETMRKIDRLMFDGDSVLGSRTEELQNIENALKIFEEKLLGELLSILSFRD